MKHYRKKPAVVPALQWDGNNTDDVLSFCHGMAHATPSKNRINLLDEGNVTIVSVGDYVVRETDGTIQRHSEKDFNLKFELS